MNDTPVVPVRYFLVPWYRRKLVICVASVQLQLFAHTAFPLQCGRQSFSSGF